MKETMKREEHKMSFIELELESPSKLAKSNSRTKTLLHTRANTYFLSSKTDLSSCLKSQFNQTQKSFKNKDSSNKVEKTQGSHSLSFSESFQPPSFTPTPPPHTNPHKQSVLSGSADIYSLNSSTQPFSSNPRVLASKTYAPSATSINGGSGSEKTFSRNCNSFVKKKLVQNNLYSPYCDYEETHSKKYKKCGKLNRTFTEASTRNSFNKTFHNAGLKAQIRNSRTSENLTPPWPLTQMQEERKKLLSKNKEKLLKQSSIKDRINRVSFLQIKGHSFNK